MLDIIGIDDNGKVHIYDLKLSKHQFKDWNTAKSHTVDWQLGMYRALLGQYVNVDDTSLMVIPISLGSLTEGKKLQVDQIVLEESQNRLGSATGTWLLPGGKIYDIARKLVPGNTDFDYNPERSQEIFDTLSILFPNYEIKTSNKEYDFEKMLDSAIRNRGFTSDITDFNTKGAISGSNKNWVTLENVKTKSKEVLKAEFTPIIEEYIKRSNQVKNLNVAQLRQKMIAAIDSGGTSIEMSSPTQQLLVNNTVQQYLNGDYDVVGNSQELSALGLILLQSKRSNSYVLLAVSSHYLKANYNNEYLYEDIEYIKGLVFFNHFAKELKLDLNQIKDIVVLNLEGTESEYKGLTASFRLYSDIMSKHSTLINNLKEHKHLLPIELKAAEDLREIQRVTLERFTPDEKTKVEGILAKYTESFNTMRQDRLKSLSAELIKAFPQLAKQTWNSGFNFSSSVEMYFAMIQVLLLIKSEQVPIGDFAGMKNFNVQASSVKDLFAGVFSDNRQQYDEYGRKIGSFIDGLKTITPDKVGSKDIQNINIMVSGTNSFTRQMFTKESTVISNHTRKYYEGIGYTKFDQQTVGNFRDKSKRLWLTDTNNNISTKWQLKNPYSYEDGNDLNEAERDYIKNILFEINKGKKELNLEPGDIKGLDISSLDAMEKSNQKGFEKIRRAMEDEDYFKMPLVRSQQIDRNARHIKQNFTQMLRNIADEMNDFVNPQDLEKSELQDIQKQLGYFEMYDIYARQTDKFKEKAILEKGADYFELDLDTIAHRAVFSQIRKKNIDNILPVINAYVWWMKMQAGKGNKDISKELEYISNRIKTSLADESIVDPEWSDVIKAASVAKRITTAGMLAFRPVLFMKEMIIGMYKGVTLAATKIYGGDQFTIKDFSTAIKKLTTIDNKFAPEWNLIDVINNTYGFANRDVNTLPKKMQTNRRGIMLGLSPWMYSMNTMPDYYNRLALFLAKMIHDGSYEAHSLDESGQMIYDPTQDKRFDHYFKVRDQYLNPSTDSPIKYVSSKTDKLYNSQKGLYDIILKQRNSERIRAGFEPYQEGDIIDMAYSEQERSSFKSFTDTVYGYYDADSQAEWHKTWYGIMYLQFLQFWPGKMSLWFGSGNKNRMSPMGYHTQKVVEVLDGENRKKKIKKWRKEVLDNNGAVIGFDEVDEDTGDPVLEWVGTPQEGLAISMLLTVKDILKGDWTHIKDEELRTRRALYGLADGLLMMLIFGMISALLAGIIEENGTDGISGSTLEFINSANTKVLNESNLWSNTFGALRSEPAFWTYSTKVAGDMLDLMQGDKTFQKVLSKDFRAFEFLNGE